MASCSPFRRLAAPLVLAEIAAGYRGPGPRRAPPQMPCRARSVARPPRSARSTSRPTSSSAGARRPSVPGWPRWPATRSSSTNGPRGAIPARRSFRRSEGRGGVRTAASRSSGSTARITTAGQGVPRPLPVTYPSYTDPAEAIASSIKAATYFPQTVFFDRNGKSSYATPARTSARPRSIPTSVATPWDERAARATRSAGSGPTAS